MLPTYNKALELCNKSWKVNKPNLEHAEIPADFLKKSVDEGLQASLSVFTLNHGSYVYHHPEEFGITWIEDAKDFFFKDCYLYACEDQAPYDLALKIFETL